MGVSLYTREQRKAFAEKAKGLLDQVDLTYDQAERALIMTKAKAYIALAQL